MLFNKKFKFTYLPNELNFKDQHIHELQISIFMNFKCVLYVHLIFEILFALIFLNGIWGLNYNINIQFNLLTHQEHCQE